MLPVIADSPVEPKVWQALLIALQESTNDSDWAVVVRRFLDDDNLLGIELYRPAAAEAMAHATAVWPHNRAAPSISIADLPPVMEFLNEGAASSANAPQWSHGHARCACLPLGVRDQRMGWLVLRWRQQRPFTGIEQDNLGLLADILALHLGAHRRPPDPEEPLIGLTTFMRLFDAIMDGVVIQNAAGEIVACNHAAESILGLTKDQMTGRTSVDPRWRAIHEDGSPFAGETHPAMVTLQTGEAQQNVAMGVHKPDGQLTWIAISTTPILHTDQERPYAVVSLFRDMTAVYNTLTHLSKSEERMSMALAGTELATWDWHIPTGEVIYSQQWAEMLGYTLSDLIPRHQTWVELMHPDDRDFALAALQAHFDGETDYLRAECRLQDATGSWVWILTRGQVVLRDGRGQPLRVVGTSVNIQKQKDNQLRLAASEKRYRRLVEGSPDILYTYSDIRGGIYYSPRVYDILGYTSEELVASPLLWNHSIHPDDARKIEEIITGSTQSAAFTIEYRIKHRQGHWIWLRDRSIGFRLENGETFIEGLATDITAEKQARLELQKNEQQFRHLAENSRDIIAHVILDPVFQFEYISPAIVEILGYMPEDIYANPQLGLDLVHPDDRESVTNFLKAPERHSPRLLIRYIHKNGHTVWIEQNLVLLMNDAGKCVALQCVGRDLTARIAREEHLLTRERFLTGLRTLTQSSLGAVGFHDMLHKITSQSARLLEAPTVYMFLKEAETDRTLYGASYGRYQPPTHDTLILSAAHPITDAVLELGEPLIIDSIKHSDYFSLRHEPVSTDQTLIALPLIAGSDKLGALLAFYDCPHLVTRADLEIGAQISHSIGLIMARGILERDLEDLVSARTSEIIAERDKTKAVLSQTAHGMALLSPQGTIQFANQAHLDAVQFTLEEMINQTCQHFWESVLPLETWQQLQPGETWQKQVVLTRKDKNQFVADMTIRGLYDMNDCCIGYVCSYMDVTKYVEVEQMRRRFLMHASHHLRTPITKLSLYLDLLNRAPENQEKYVAVLLGETNRLKELMSDLMLINELDAIADNVVKASQSPGILVHSVINRYQTFAAEKDVMVTLLTDDHPLPDIGAIGNYLGKAIGEIVENAIGFSPPGGVVTITLMKSNRYGRPMVGVAVADKGSGILYTEQAKIFDYFYKTPSGGSGLGNGLGLSIATTIIRFHGGYIEVDSMPGRGSVFTVWIPIFHS